MALNGVFGEMQKFVRLRSDEIIIFASTLEHSTFKALNPVSAGMCIVDLRNKRVSCFGESNTLQLKADEQVDTEIATVQIFGAPGK